MNKDVKLFFYVGISASGKTTKAYEMHSEDAVIIDSDQTREKLLGSADRQDQNARVFEHMWRETCECIECGISVAYVATNLAAKRRISFLKSIHKRFPSLDCTCYIINTPIETCYKRNAERERHVPDFVISRQIRSFQIPTLKEGWSRIRVINNYEEGTDSFQYLREMVMKVSQYGDQKNKHHSLTLLDHCTKCGRLAEEYGYGDTIQQAAYIHDYGKVYTAERWPDKDDDIHYPCHSQVGSYLALNMGYDLHVAQLVGGHMYPYAGEQEQKVWRERYGELLWEDILRLHRCDSEAH